MSDPETIAIYDARATDYAAQNEDYVRRDPQLATFIAACPAGGHVLDLGCGPGTSSALLAEAGLKVLATDASAGMVELAGQHPGVTARQATFDEIEGEDLYDGIWASFCLLHAPRADFPRHLAALRRALKPGGSFAIGMKLGEGEARDKIGRLYTYYTREALMTHLKDAGFTPVSETSVKGEGLDGSMAQLITVICDG
ncbi:class I SAM-dependent methyltransferase [Pseudodonghicola flavimaris]|uniref:Class I SAM-dependent methyltransferase n=1 Tax=Pseudodonghicola flavimaris TaxID=3050036 RepID=A0ABT7F6J7_9RHOB|nr:class I SAM-dependent methyltransferase [Pseudodonghicola flavimaris]MDK3020239.1 class I SAM-dependent methyltransferase [Pseudodonghicola flavimaris]